MDDLDKYTLEQAKIEIEQSRSWPTKILAFYSATNAALVAAVITARRTFPQFHSLVLMWSIIILIVISFAWAIALFAKYHLSYLRYRNMQIGFQKVNQDKIQNRFIVPNEWFMELDVCITTRWFGWTFYVFLAFLIAIAAIAGLLGT